MRPLIAVLTYNRLQILKDCLESFATAKPLVGKIVVFDDCSSDGTAEWLRDRMIGVEYKLATKRGGVAINSNRAIKYFLERRNYSTLFLLNDDLLVNPDVFQIYLDATEKTKYNFFSYTDERSPYKPSAEFTKNGVMLVRRKAGDGCFTVLTRKAVETLGGFDVNFGLFGGEDLDMQRRASAAGLCLDSLDVKAAQGLVIPRQYYENIPRALGAETDRHLNVGRKYWIETMNENPVIWKEIIT